MVQSQQSIFQSKRPCEKCDGSGAAPNTTIDTCEPAGGVGQVRMQQGFFSIQQTCPKCRGKGKTIKVPCDYCRGTGLSKENKKLSIKVPAVSILVTSIRLSGEGEAGQTMGQQAIFTSKSVYDNMNYSHVMKGDLLCQVPISFDMAALGGELKYQH